MLQLQGPGSVYVGSLSWLTGTLKTELRLLILLVTPVSCDEVKCLLQWCRGNRWHVSADITDKTSSHPRVQPSLLSAEPLLPPHNFHSLSLRRLPLYQSLRISQPMPVSLSVGQPTLPLLPAHHRVLPAHTSLSPPRVPPFLSLPRHQPSYRLDQVCWWICIYFLFLVEVRG